ncbi:MAG: PSD1 domain-containing protein [Planctomycetaceae bacterium]|nr:PSD1 domain-containing protein [Planctomycetaceae bacterium]
MQRTRSILVLVPLVAAMSILLAGPGRPALADDGADFFEKQIRPLLTKHCYECHSEAAGEREGGLLLDRETGWLKGGNTQQAVIPGEPDASLLVTAIRYQDEEMQMPPDEPLPAEAVKLFEEWIRRGAPGPAVDLAESEFSRLGDQHYLSELASEHWSLQPLAVTELPQLADPIWNKSPLDRYVGQRLHTAGLTPSTPADARSLVRRFTYDLTGLPPTAEEVREFATSYRQDADAAVERKINDLLSRPAFGEHIGRMWLDVARYADTDSTYRPDTRTPKYLPFAFTYRNYVIDAFNADKPFDLFLREQLAADLMGYPEDAPERAALGFLTVGPHVGRRDDEIDDWIDVTTRGLMGLTAACARCHDHKFEAIPTADYYALYGVFASTKRSDPLRESELPKIHGAAPVVTAVAEYEQKRKQIDAEIKGAGNSKTKNNNRSIAERIEETDLAELLTFHEGGPVRMMVVRDVDKPITPRIFLRGEPANRGDAVPRRFLSLLDREQTPYPVDTSGRLQLAEQIASPENPLTGRVFVNRVWGMLMGHYLVSTPSDFGLQGAAPTHPELLDWLTLDFITHGWSVKHLVATIVRSQTYRQQSLHREEAATIDPGNDLYWRAERKHLSIEQMRDGMLAVSEQLNRMRHDRPQPLWGDDYSRHRTIYGFVNRFNLDPTLRSFDFPTPMHSSESRPESIVAPQALFAMNAPFVIEQATTLTDHVEFKACQTDGERTDWLFQQVLQRPATKAEVTRCSKVVEQQSRFFEQPRSPQVHTPWALVAQALLMSNEFQYLD